MPRRRPLPEDLVGGPFRTAEARRRGVGDRRLSAPDLAHPFHGVATVAPAGGAILDRCEAYAARLIDGQIFSHTTALSLWGAPVPRPERGEVHLSVAFPRTPPRTRDAAGHSLRLVEPMMVRGLPASRAEAAWCEAASNLRPEDLVAAGDFLVTGPRGGRVRGPAVTDVERLVAAVARRRWMRGGDAARWALARITTGVDSAGETRLRLLLAHHGLPAPETDVDVHIGDIVLHADLGYRTARVMLDYEGDGHRVDRAQWMRDVRRRELFEDAGFRHIRVVAADLRDPLPLISRLGRLLSGRPPA